MLHELSKYMFFFFFNKPTYKQPHKKTSHPCTLVGISNFEFLINHFSFHMQINESTDGQKNKSVYKWLGKIRFHSYFYQTPSPALLVSSSYFQSNNWSENTFMTFLVVSYGEKTY